MFGLGRIFKMVPDSITDIVNQINQQVNRIQEEVTSPIRNMVGQVMGGIWKGDGANRFVDEMLNEVIPALVSIAGISLSFGNLIKKSFDRMTSVVKQTASIAGGLVDTFSKIF